MTKKRYTLDELLARSEGAYPLPPEEREWVDAPTIGREIESEAEAAAWRAKVQEALDDTRPTIPHEQVMAEAQALIDTKKKG
ncbi:hypothetical protein ACNDVF_004985 [Escherichia coli]|nr:Growth regulator [Klebsiella pneumoniae]